MCEVTCPRCRRFLSLTPPQKGHFKQVSCWGCNFAFLLEVTESGTHIVSGMVLGEAEGYDQPRFDDREVTRLQWGNWVSGPAPWMPLPDSSAPIETPRDIALAIARAEQIEDYETCAVLRDRLKALQNPIL
jgi:hypothetical protein